jgi:hypothetical protein
MDLQRRLYITVSAVFLAATVITGQPERKPQAPIMLGVLNQDGAMLPLFRYARGEWTAPWQYAATAPPASVAAIPASWWPGFSRRGWSIGLPKSTRPLVIRRIAKVRLYCNDVIGVQTDYVDDPPYVARWDHAPGTVGVAAVGPVTVHAVASMNQFSDSNNPQWHAADERLRDWLQRKRQPFTEVRLEFATRIPRSTGGDVWELQAWVDNKRFVRIWYSDGPVEPFMIFVDGGGDELAARGIEPIGAVWITNQRGEQDLLILARHTGWEGGEYAMFRIRSKGITELISDAASGC